MHLTHCYRPSYRARPGFRKCLLSEVFLFPSLHVLPCAFPLHVFFSRAHPGSLTRALGGRPDHFPGPPRVAELKPEGTERELRFQNSPASPSPCWPRISPPPPEAPSSSTCHASLCLPAGTKSLLPSFAVTGCHGNGDNRHPQSPWSVCTWSLARWWRRRGQGVGVRLPAGTPGSRHPEGESCQSPPPATPLAYEPDWDSGTVAGVITHCLEGAGP